jgi:hypothetical protein
MENAGIIWHVSYRRGDEMGFCAVTGRNNAIGTACDFLDRGYDVLRIIKNNTTEQVSAQEIALSHSKRKAGRPQ